MPSIVIDTEKCKQDGICADECPAGIIKFEKDAFPEPVQGFDEFCIRCGHCLAVCPHGALSLHGVSPDACDAVDKGLLPAPEQIAHFMRARRSSRKFKSKPVPREIIAQCLDTVRWAPSGHNAQPVHWLVIHDTEEVRRLAGLVADWMRMLVASGLPIVKKLHLDIVVSEWDKGVDKIVRGAQHIVVAHGLRDDPTAATACTIALAHFELIAKAHGLGPTWAGFFHAAAGTYPPLQQALALPDGHQVMGAMLLGYSKYSYARIPEREPARITWK
jgi:nitroreductase/NAD-dependent dihydropyrimidine dehydrogenase PreA subunit